MTSQRLRAALTDIASYLPAGRLTNEMLAEHSDDWTAASISEKTGIDSRCIAAPDEFTSDMAVAAAEKLFAKDPSYREGIDCVFLTTVTPDSLVPSTAPMVQARLGLPTNIGAFDVTLGCSGYPYGLTLAASLVESGRYRRILFITSDRFATCAAAGTLAVQTIIGDGATANLIEAVDPGQPHSGAVIGATRTCTDGRGANTLTTRTSGMRGWVGAEEGTGVPAFEMNGSDVFNFTLKDVVPHIRDFLADQELGVEDVALFVFHQANGFMLEHMRRRLKIREDQMVLHMAEVGNTVSSSIPIALEAALAEGRVTPGAKVMLCAFGVGFSWASVLLEYPG